MYWALSGVSAWCEGILKHYSSGELHFGIEKIDGGDFMFVINIHFTNHPRFQFLNTNDGVPFFAPGRHIIVAG
jgi:hypothetical protein